VTTFRVHFSDGRTVDVRASNADAARDQARDQVSKECPGVRITKVKVLREKVA
jgi:hypothetical protein